MSFIRSFLVFSLVFGVATTQAAEGCVEFLSESTLNTVKTSENPMDQIDLEDVTFDLARTVNLYSPWYYSFLKEAATEKEMLTVLANVDETRLKVLAEAVHTNLIDSDKLKTSSDLKSLELEALLKSLKAIQKAKRFPVTVEFRAESNQNVKWASRGLMFVGGVALVSSFFMPDGEMARIIAGSGFLSTVGGVFNFYFRGFGIDAVTTNDTSVVAFVISEGKEDELLSLNHYEVEDGKLIQTGDDYEAQEYYGNYVVSLPKPS